MFYDLSIVCEAMLIIFKKGKRYNYERREGTISVYS